MVLAWIVGCGPSVGSPSAGSSESTTSADSTSTGSASLTATGTSSPSSSESSTTASADVASGETSIPLDLGGGASSSESGDFDQCARCGSDEVCLDIYDDNCTPALPCVPIPAECEEVTCDDPECAEALCGDGECQGYGAESCLGVSDGFVCVLSGGSVECDHWSQDCPKGEKCNAWSEDGGELDSLVCIPIAPITVGVGEPCSVDDYATSGIDDCIFGAQCLEVDPDTLVGICRALCTGNENNPSCADPEMTCTISDDHFGWCLP